MSIKDTSENGSSVLRVTRHVSRLDFSLKDKWLVRYDPAEFTYPEILALLPAVQAHLQLQKLNYKTINLNFSRTIPRNRFFQVGDDIFIRHNGNDKRLQETDPGAFAVPTGLEALVNPIRSLHLLFPRLESDPRWKTMGLPAAQLFLASALQASGFAVTPVPLVLPAGKLPPEAFMADMAGITVFEDLLPFLRPFLAGFHAVYNGWLAAGGPFPTLAPLAALFHLPQVNLFVRGEAEMALPGILDALNRGDLEALFRQKGLCWQQPGLIVLSDFDRVIRPETFSRFKIDLAFLRPEHLQHGLEMNFSRGCSRGCVFCCRAQGNTFRKLPLEKIDELLKKYTQQIEKSIEKLKSPGQEPHPSGSRGFSKEQSCQIPPLSRGDKGGIEISGSESGRVTNPPLREPGPPSTERLNSHIDSKSAYTMNINDDDILQDPAYAQEIFTLLKKNGLRIFGVQTSIASLVSSDSSPKPDVLDLVADPGLFVENSPLLWLGTDVFLPERARRLGKKLFSKDKFARLLAEMEKRGLRHYHYWISSDGDSTWEEFVDELALIFSFCRDFPGFGLLAHAPFIVPYQSSRLFQRLPAGAPNLKIKLDLSAPDPRFSYQVAERLETRWPNLNRLLKNEKTGGERGFLDFLKDKNFAAAAQLAYHYLKQEQLQMSANESGDLARGLAKLEELIQSII